MDVDGSVKGKSFSCNYRHKHNSEKWYECGSTAISLYSFHPHFLCKVMPCFKSVRESKSKRTIEICIIEIFLIYRKKILM